MDTGEPAKHRGPSSENGGERLCDQIAAEILMLSLAFEEDGWLEDWSIRGVSALARKYDTSITATARRMVDLMPEKALMGIWKLTGNDSGKPNLQWSHSGRNVYGVPSASVVSSERMMLINQAWNSNKVESGVTPVVDKRSSRVVPLDVPAETMAWGRDEFKQVMVYYYPDRNSEAMLRLL